MTDKGEAYMTMQKMVATRPHRSFLSSPCTMNKETKATVAITEITKARRPKILAFSFFEAYTVKISTYTNSIVAPVPLIVLIRRLFAVTNGRPYLEESTTCRTEKNNQQ